ncbi:hypothetical protein LO772_34485 [Yinghuangia sp. ASG 101]|uniref:hypothetical protein n=1 Tax=Yinghuangia sp. ASG 101 TaxID=2896848 RepID=UPI001E382B16|nr:hypothetical protein [Yinghuangia sp. ASG 101]UGQ11819.1 hypothetical protein LO772_34485 [Yinghuangia sp. ASG 101]
MDAAGVWVPRECTLPTREQPLRMGEFDDLFAASLRGVVRPEPARARLLLVADAEPVARELASRETGCCAFFAFGFEPGDATGTVWMDVSVPASRIEVLDALVARAEASRLSRTEAP